ncbi:MAG: adenosine deaminase, partial [Mesorhizobium sp.]
IAAEHFRMDDKALTAVTRTAIEAAFVDKKTKAMLLSRLDARGR